MEWKRHCYRVGSHTFEADDLPTVASELDVLVGNARKQIEPWLSAVFQAEHLNVVLLRELPSLPSRQAILLGWATPIPILVEMDELPEAERPHSADPDFWNVWTLKAERVVDWGRVSDDWAEARDDAQAEVPGTDIFK